ncbi:MAG: hypothetical protein M1826_005168 [Phylliscum demangeonii]|nr:MAG: hypothetical protein M1826_005168 [Phylliscum demangeonii]
MTAEASYLEEDPSTTVLERRRLLAGYELYLVEQWACSRMHPTFVIVTYTGDPSHSVVVGVLSIPTDEEAWSPRLRLYFKAVAQSHARRKETPLGILMVTNLGGFPSALTVILVPDGDIRRHRENLIVNENLKRLGCSGRAGLTLSPAADATRSMFYQLYKVSDRVPFQAAVVELVKLCQVALMLFAKLGSAYADGLLCDVTERAIHDWWTEVGSDFYNAEPHDGILGPTTVAAILGLLIGTRNRLGAYGAPVAKDVFDVGSTKRGIAYFQKSQKSPRLLVTRRLDRSTLDRLHRVSAKAASGEGWMVPKTLKSTMAELGGKGGEMVKEMVGARDKAGIAEVETLEIERFVQLVRGERCKWLWLGKPRKTTEPDSFGKVGGYAGPAVGKDRRGEYVPLIAPPDSSMGRMRGELEVPTSPLEQAQSTPDSVASGLTEMGDREASTRRTVFKSMTDKMSDARSGFERIKDAVNIPGRRVHPRPLREETLPTDPRPIMSNQADVNVESEYLPAPSSQVSRQSSTRKRDLERPTPMRTRMDQLRRERAAEDAAAAIAVRARSHSASPSASKSTFPTPPGERALSGSEQGAATISRDQTLADADETALPGEKTREPGAPARFSGRAGVDPSTSMLRRTQSWSEFITNRHQKRHVDWWPRHLSFADAEEATFAWRGRSSLDQLDDAATSQAAGGSSEAMDHDADARRAYAGILQLNQQMLGWVHDRVEDVEQLDNEAGRDQDGLHALYYQRLKEHEGLQSSWQELIAERRNRLAESIRDMDVLGARLDYEIGALAAKVEDVEDGVEVFARQVLALEAKADEYEAAEQLRESWPRWIVRLVKGEGKIESQFP